MALHGRQNPDTQRSDLRGRFTRRGGDLGPLLILVVGCGRAYDASFPELPIVDATLCVESPLTTELCPVPDCAMPCATQEERIQCCVDTFGVEVAGERHARCLAHAHGLEPGLAECFVQEANDHFAVLNFTYEPACAEFGPIGGEDYAIRRSGTLGARGVWSGQGYGSCSE